MYPQSWAAMTVPLAAVSCGRSSPEAADSVRAHFRQSSTRNADVFTACTHLARQAAGNRRYRLAVKMLLAGHQDGAAAISRASYSPNAAISHIKRSRAGRAGICAPGGCSPSRLREPIDKMLSLPVLHPQAMPMSANRAIISRRSAW